MILEKELENKIENIENIEKIKNSSFIEEDSEPEENPQKEELKLTDFFHKKAESINTKKLEETLQKYSSNNKNLKKLKKIRK